MVQEPNPTLTTTHTASTQNLIATTVFPKMGYKFPFFNPFQSLFYPEYNKDTNVVVSAPTGSGKTVIAEMIVNNAVVENNGRAIFLAPMRSLTLEKFTDWTKENHPFAEFKPSILTGDFKLTEAKKKELQESKVICMTSEMLDSRTRRMKAEGNAWLSEVTALIVDESHIIGMKNENTVPLQERGHKLESAIMRFTQLNKNARIILLSATLPNLPELGGWLEKLNRKKTNIIVSDYHPQPVIWHLDTYHEVTGYGSYHTNKSNMFGKAVDTLQAFPDDMWLIFCHSKNDGRRMQNLIQQQLDFTPPFHCADLEKGERIEFENGFKDKKHKILIATSTLAYGVNLPARRVMILDSKRGLTTVHPYDIKQMGGRAGRPGIDPCGDVHWICGSVEQYECKRTIDQMPKAESLMFDLDTFAFHIVTEIAEGQVRTRQHVIDWYNRCLAAHQGAQVTEQWINDLINKLIEVQAITENNSILTSTNLGRVASWLYFSPFDVWNWHCNLKAVANSKREDDAAIAWMWGSVRNNAMSYIPKDCSNVVSDFQYKLKGIGPIKQCETICAGIYLQLQGKEWKDMPSSVISPVRNIIHDVERYAQALLLIDSKYAHTDSTLLIKMAAIRIAYGVDKNAAKFCMLPKIGKKRAQALIKSNVMSLQEFIQKDEICKEILGEKIYSDAVIVAKDLIS